MHLFKVAFYITGIVHFCVNPAGIIIFAAILVLYWLVGNFIPGAHSVNNNRKVSFSAWTEPREGNLHIHEEISIAKVEEFLEKNYRKEDRPTLTHVAVRAAAEALVRVPTMNGKIAFGNFVPFKKIDMSVLVELADGTDLAMMLLTDCANKTFEDLKQVIARKSLKIKSSASGDEQHKKRTGAANFLPTFILGATTKVVKFITCDLNMNLNILGMRKNGFGVAMVTAIGKLGFQDATAPFTSFSNNSMILAINKIYDKAVVKDGEITTEKYININIVVDNRLFSQNDNREFLPAFRKVFENPQLYSRVKNPE